MQISKTSNLFNKRNQETELHDTHAYKTKIIYGQKVFNHKIGIMLMNISANKIPICYILCFEKG